MDGSEEGRVSCYTVSRRDVLVAKSLPASQVRHRVEGALETFTHDTTASYEGTSISEKASDNRSMSISSSLTSSHRHNATPSSHSQF
jgi:hypothetical protein